MEPFVDGNEEVGDNKVRQRSKWKETSPRGEFRKNFTTDLMSMRRQNMASLRSMKHFEATEFEDKE